MLATHLDKFAANQHLLQQVPRCFCGDVVFVELAHVVLVDEPGDAAAIVSAFSMGGSSCSDLYGEQLQ